MISSYTPTLTALTRTRQPPMPAPVRQLTVGMPTTPGLPPLPAVPAEMKVVARHFPPGEVNHQLVESRATRSLRQIDPTNSLVWAPYLPRHLRPPPLKSALCGECVG